jgi:outer membrane receptor protein involved in Fe transport
VRDAYRLTLSPFYSKLSRVGGAQLFNNPDGSSYTTDPLYSTTETLGIEIEGDVSFARIFNVRTALTIQRPESKDFAIWVANGLGPADDTISTVPDGDADNNPKLMANTTLQVAPTDRFAGFLTWKYMGARAANRFNTFELPAFSQFDLGASFDATSSVSVSLNVNNVFNSEGVMSWAPSGGLLASLDRQAFTPQQLAANPNQLFNILTIQPRAYFLSANVKF